MLSEDEGSKKAHIKPDNHFCGEHSIFVYFKVWLKFTFDPLISKLTSKERLH